MDENRKSVSMDLSLSLSTKPIIQESEPINPPTLSNIPEPQRAQRKHKHIHKRARCESRKLTKSETIAAPFLWATDRRATVHTLKYLLENGMQTISGEVHCKRCDKIFSIDYNVEEKFREIATFIIKGKDEWHDRAPKQWVGYELLTCESCGHEKSCKPLISEKKKSINWLFLFLGQFLGCCTLDQLKYFCKHTNIHRTGAKNRVLLYTYLALCKQLEPHGPFYYQSI